MMTAQHTHACMRIAEHTRPCMHACMTTKINPHYPTHLIRPDAAMPSCMLTNTHY